MAQTEGTINSVVVLRNLIERGWIPLRQMSALLGYKNPRAIYTRQKGRNKIPTIRIGGTERVYADDVLETLQGIQGKNKGAAEALLAVYNTGLKEHWRRKEKHAELFQDQSDDEDQ